MVPLLRVAVVALAAVISAASEVLTWASLVALMSAASASVTWLDRGLNGHGLDHTHVSHELRDHHASGLYFWPPLSDYNNDCPWPADLTIESCPVGSATE